MAVGNVLTLPTTGSVTINMNDFGGLSGIVPLFTYGLLGNSFNASQLTVGAMSSDGTGAYAFRNTGSTSTSGEIDVVAPTKLTWSGTAGNAWDTNASANFSALNQLGAVVFNANYSGYGVKDHVTFNDAGSGGTVAIAPAGVLPQSVAFGNSTKAYTLSGGPILGSTSLAVSGGGLVTVTNSNGYTGPTSVSAGTLQLGDGLVGQDGSIDATSGATVGGGARLAFDLAGTRTVSYPIDGSGSLAMTGPGELVLGGVDSYSGGTYVSSGKLVVTNPLAIRSGSNLTVGMASDFSPAPIVADSSVAGVASIAPVPEPGTLALLAAAAAIVVLRSVRRRKP